MRTHTHTHLNFLQLLNVTHTHKRRHTHTVINLCPILPAAPHIAAVSFLLLGYIHTDGAAHPLSHTFCLCPYADTVSLIVRTNMHLSTHTHTHIMGP